MKSVVLGSIKGMKEMPDSNDYHDMEENELQKKNLKMIEEAEAFDDVSGAKLDKDLVEKARREEIEYFHQKEVYEKITRAEAKRRGIKVVKVRWIDINKGDDEKPEYR